MPRQLPRTERRWRPLCRAPLRRRWRVSLHRRHIHLQHAQRRVTSRPTRCTTACLRAVTGLPPSWCSTASTRCASVDAEARRGWFQSPASTRDGSSSRALVVARRPRRARCRRKARCLTTEPDATQRQRQPHNVRRRRAARGSTILTLASPIGKRLWRALLRAWFGASPSESCALLCTTQRRRANCSLGGCGRPSLGGCC